MLLNALGLSLPKTGERALQRAQEAAEKRGVSLCGVEGRERLLQHREPKSLGIQGLKHEGPAIVIARPVLNKKDLPVGKGFHPPPRMKPCANSFSAFL